VVEIYTKSSATAQNMEFIVLTERTEKVFQLATFVYRGLQLKRTEIENEPQNEHQEKRSFCHAFYGTKRIPCKLI
jgi:hypothetical protein